MKQKLPVTLPQQPRTIAELNLNFNAFHAKTFAQALIIARNFLNIAYDHTGPLYNHAIFKEGNSVVYKFYDADGNAAYIVF